MLAPILSLSSGKRITDRELAQLVRYLMWWISQGEKLPKGAFNLLLHLAVRSRSGRGDVKVDQLAAVLGAGKRHGLHPKSVDKAIAWLLHERADWLERVHSDAGAPRKAFSIEPLVRRARDHESRILKWLDGLDH